MDVIDRKFELLWLVALFETFSLHEHQVGLVLQIDALGFLVDVLVVRAEAIVFLRPALLPGLLEIESRDFVPLIAIVAALPFQNIDCGEYDAEYNHCCQD